QQPVDDHLPLPCPPSSPFPPFIDDFGDNFPPARPAKGSRFALLIEEDLNLPLPNLHGQNSLRSEEVTLELPQTPCPPGQFQLSGPAQAPGTPACLQPFNYRS